MGIFDRVHKESGFRKTSLDLGSGRGRYLKPNREELRELREADRMRDYPHGKIQTFTRGAPQVRRELAQHNRTKRTHYDNSELKAIRGEEQRLKAEEKRLRAEEQRLKAEERKSIVQFRINQAKVRQAKRPHFVPKYNLPPSISNPIGFGYGNTRTKKSIKNQRDPIGLNLVGKDFGLL